jgi:uncharacterized protein YodC (DUF2158 family)
MEVTGNRSMQRDHATYTLNRFQCGDRVRVLEGRDEMTVIIALGDQVHCEWFVGTELQQRAFSASLLRRMDGPSR